MVDQAHKWGSHAARQSDICPINKTRGGELN
jgi:hypothetical protein